MTDSQVESLVDDVIDAFGLTTPIDLALIASEEGVTLAEGDYGEEFHGRIEYLTEVETFVIYYPSVQRSHYPSRVRFSIGHEFGHYYIPHHREILLKGKSHYSLEGFRHKNPIEREADLFSASLLIPRKLLKDRIGKRGFLTLAQILKLADDCKASVQATAFRYTRFTTEPHLALVSERGKVLYGFSSQEARAWGFSFFKDLTWPDECATRKAATSSGIVEGKTSEDMWFPHREKSSEMWEEAYQLGNSNRILTLLSWSNYGKGVCGK